jgi:hypothetical protein
MDRWPRAGLEGAKDRKQETKLPLYLTNAMKAYGIMDE